MPARDMGELQAARSIAHGIDPPVRAAQPVIDCDTLRREGHPRLVQPHRVQRDRTAHRHQKMRPFHQRAIAQRHLDRAFRSGQTHHGLPFQNADAFGLQVPDQQGGKLGVFAAKGTTRLDHRNRGPKPTMRLRHFHPDRPAADDQQMIRALPQGKDCLVGQKRRCLYPHDLRHKGARSGGDHEPPRADHLPPGLNLMWRGKTCKGTDHRAPQPLEPLLTVDRGDFGNDGGDVILDGGVVDLRLNRGDPGKPPPLRLGGLGGGDQRL